MLFDIRDFGAVAEPGVINTKAIQAAIDACHGAGGGKVVVSGGTYTTGTLVMKSHVNLFVEASGVLLSSPNCGKYAENQEFDNSRPYPFNVIYSGIIEDYGDYPEVEKRHVEIEALPRNRGTCLIYAENAENFAITGMGTINGNGPAFTEVAPAEANHYTYYRRIHAPTPPRVVFLTGCRNVCIENITIVDPPAGWSYWIHDCDYVTFDKVKILADQKYPNNDGIHINCSRNVTVSNANLVCSDDCIIIRANSRSLKEDKPCENVTITNCNLNTPAGGIRIGFVNDGVIRNCVMSNVVMENNHAGVFIELPDQELIQSDYGREASLVENISFSNIIMNNVYYPVLIIMGQSEKTQIKAVRRLYFSDIRATCGELPYIRGRSGNRIEDIQFSNCTFYCRNEKPNPVMEYTNDISFTNARFITE